MTQLDRILALTDAIEAAVEAGDWPRATALDQERRSFLSAALCADPATLVAQGMREVLADLVARNEATLARVATMRTELEAEARRLLAAPAAVRSYERTAARDGGQVALAGGDS